jgi:hypothetical protein
MSDTTVGAVIQVVENVEGWHVTTDERGVNGTRVFLQDDDETRDTVDLPAMGDLFEDIPGKLIYGCDNLLLKEIACEALDKDKRKIIYTCTYKNEPCDISAYETEGNTGTPIDPTELPAYFETGGEFMDIDNAEGWKWTNAGDALTQTVPVQQVNGTLRIKRIVKGDDIENFFDCSEYLEGCINKETFYRRDPWCWMYMGFIGNSQRDFLGRNILDCELIFSYRAVTGLTGNDDNDNPADGWPWVFNIATGLYDLPVDSEGSIVYYRADFLQLFNNTDDPQKD